MIKNVFVNALGRIGKPAAFHVMQQSNLRLVGINEPRLQRVGGLVDINETINLLRKQDARHTKYDWNVRTSNKPDSISIEGQRVRMFATTDPTKIPFREMGVDYVLECSGFYDDKQVARKGLELKPENSAARIFLEQGVERVVQTYPAETADISLILGANHDRYNPKLHQIISNASCTTKSLALPLVVMMANGIQIESMDMVTVHAATASQSTLDVLDILSPHTTGAAKNLEKIIPELKGRISATSVRTPITDGSLSYMFMNVSSHKKLDAQLLNRILEGNVEEEFYQGRYAILSEKNPDTREIVGRPENSVILGSETKVRLEDASQYETKGLRRYMVRLVSGYDNEKGSSVDPVMLLSYIARQKA